jgi:hypothetical protein
MEKVIIFEAAQGKRKIYWMADVELYNAFVKTWISITQFQLVELTRECKETLMNMYDENVEVYIQMIKMELYDNLELSIFSS